MPIYALSKELAFPPVDAAEPDGLLAVGGDLSPERLLLAYRAGIFPWYDAGGPLLWWSPDPRFVLFPERLKVSKSMARILKTSPWTLTWDRDFAGVIRSCKTISRRDQPGTWITPAMQKAYIRLHELGYAHSVEVWRGRELIGGLYGLSLGAAFFGESMFARVSNASKLALIGLVRGVQQAGFHFIDCQVHTEHLESLGAEPVPRSDFCARLQAALQCATLQGKWTAWGAKVL